MNISEPPGKRWTRSMVLSCINAELSSIGFVRIGSRLYHQGPVEIFIDVDVVPSRNDQTGQATSPWVTFVAQPKGCDLVQQHVWPAGTDTEYIKNLMGSLGQRENYTLAPNQAFSDSRLHKTVTEYVGPFLHDIKALDGYFNLLSFQRLNLVKTINSLDARDIMQLFATLVAADYMNNRRYALIAAEMLQKLLREGGDSQKDRVTAIVNARPRLGFLMDTYLAPGR